MPVMLEDLLQKNTNASPRKAALGLVQEYNYTPRKLTDKDWKTIGSNI